MMVFVCIHGSIVITPYQMGLRWPGLVRAQRCAVGYIYDSIRKRDRLTRVICFFTLKCETPGQMRYKVFSFNNLRVSVGRRDITETGRDTFTQGNYVSPLFLEVRQ